MEDSSEVHMETDVSSTTDDMPGTQEVTGSNGEVEMVIVVEKIEDEDNCFIASGEEQPQQGTNVSSASNITEISPLKEAQSQSVHIKSPVKENNASKPILKSPMKSESLQKLPCKDSRVTESAMLNIINTQTESIDSSTKIKTIISPVISVQKSPIKLVHGIKVIKPPFKDYQMGEFCKTDFKMQEKSKTEVKLQEKTPPKEENKLQEKTPTKDNMLPEKNPTKEVELEEKSPTKESKLLEKTPKENKLQETTSTNEIKMQEKTPTKEIKLQEKAPTKENKLVEKTPPKENKLQEKPIKHVKLQEISSTVKETKVQEKSKNEVELQDKSIKVIVVQEKARMEVTVQEKSGNRDVNLRDKPNKDIKLQEPPQNILDTSKDVEMRDVSKSTNNKTFTSDCTEPNDKIASSTSSPKENEAMVITEENNDKTDNVTLPVDVVIEKDGLNDSQMSTDSSEKEHNKSISRELKSLIKSAKDSKIISECTQLTSKTRKSRTHLDASNTSLNASIEAEIVGNRRASCNSQVSTCSEKSDKALKRSMRSQNPEFVNKCKQFLNSVTSKVMKDSDEAMSEEDTDSKAKENTKQKDTESRNKQADSSLITPKRQKVSDRSMVEKVNKLRSDMYCWRCHWTVEQDTNDKAHPPLHCTVCPRSFHFKCMTSVERKVLSEKNWVCPDCLQILNAESSETRSPAMKKIPLGMLCELLKHAVDRMMDLNGVEPFMQPVDRTTFPDYDKYVVHPMDLTQMKQNIADGHYGSTEAFTADTQWILHNSIIFNTLQSKLTAGARALVRSCRAEMSEIEACPECYAAAHARRTTWFTDVCSTPHILLWAKLKGFPYWPAKAMTVNSSGLVDVRFFGAHDRAWVPAKDCFLYSEKDPNNFRNKRQDILDSMQEAENHIRNISRKYGKFVYPPFKTQFDPSKLTEQLKLMIPSFEGRVKSPVKEKHSSASPLSKKRRSNSKGSKSSANDGDTSECDDTTTAARTEALKHQKEPSEKEKPKEAAALITREVETLPSRKRRRSNLEEAQVITIMESSSSEKKRRIEDTNAKQPHTRSKEEPTKGNKEAEKEVKRKESKEADVTNTATKKKADTPKAKSKDDEPSSRTAEDKDNLRVTPIKLVALPRTNKQTPKMFATTKVTSEPVTPKDDKTPQKTKTTRADKSLTEKKDEKAKAKRRNSRANKSLNSTSTPKEKEKRSESNEASSKEQKSKESTNKKKETEKSEADKLTAGKSLLKPIDSPKSVKDRLQFDDDTSLAVIARKTRNSNTGLPTISNVVSLSTTAQPTASIATKTTTAAKSIEVTVEANSNSSIFTPTITDNVRNMKEAVNKLERLRNNTEAPIVGRVGVRAFARMTSPERTNDAVEVEIKAEPVDLDEADAERLNEKMDLMNACRLQPVNQTQSLRDVRINKVVVSQPVVVKKVGVIETASTARAKKTFPQPRRVEDGRSELNGKNSMVYIPIQPPMTQAPMRPIRPALANGPNRMPGPRLAAPFTSANNVNTVTTPLKPVTSLSSSTPSTSTNTITPTAGPLAVGQGPTVGPATVHTLPMMTSVNGQWMFSLQPVMSVGAVDNTSSTMVNGLAERQPVTPATLALPAQPNRTVTDNNTPAELPRLQQRPALVNPLDASATPAPFPPPAAAGPLSAKLNQSAVKLADFFRSLLEDSLEKLDEPAAAAAALRLQLEQARWRHQQEIKELKHNHELTLSEVRLSFEKDKLRVASEVRRVVQAELDVAVKLAKSKQWCANCNQEAQFYCCWNTAYCDYGCQRAHWATHYAHCAQPRNQHSKRVIVQGRAKSKDGSEDGGDAAESRLQPQADLPKGAPALTPALTAAAQPRVFAPEPQPNKPAIIVSMVEDNSGNQTMKCVGTYKPNKAQASPLIINKQVLSEESGKKVVTSGGYLIVGSSGSSSVMTPAASRRPHTIQYFT